VLIGEEFVRGIEHYGRWHMQEYVARSREITDVLAYLRAETVLAMFKAISFVTLDSIHFSRKTDPLPLLDEAGRTSRHEGREIQRISPIDSKTRLEEG
jgi:hypothetical protein